MGESPSPIKIINEYFSDDLLQEDTHETTISASELRFIPSKKPLTCHLGHPVVFSEHSDTKLRLIDGKLV